MPETASPDKLAVERYAVACLCLILPWALRFLLNRILGTELPYVFFALGAIVAAWYGRFRVGLLVLIVGIFLGYYFFVPPQGQMAPLKFPELAQLISAGLPTIIAIGMIELQHRSKARLDAIIQREQEHAERLQKEIEERERARNELRFAQEITLAIGEAENLQSALGVALQKTCDFTGWSLGNAWVPLIGGTTMELCPAVCTCHPDLQKFRELTSHTCFRLGEGVVGKVWQTRKPLWIHDLREVPDFSRASVAKEEGIRSGLFFPILAKGEVVAILEFFHVEISAKDDGFVRLISSVATQVGNLVERRQAEEQLRQSERRLNEAQAVAQMGNWEWDIERNELLWSDHLYHLFGVDRDHFFPGYREFLDRVHPEDRAHVEQTVTSSLQTGEPFSFEHKVIRDNGLHYFQCRGAVLRNEAGKVVKMLGTAQDITEQKETAMALAAARVELQNYASALERTVGTRTAELEDSVRQLESFCYTIAHDLRAPLRAMEGFTRAILEDYAPQLDPTGQEYARRVIAASRRMDQLIQDLLAYGRLTHATFPKTSVDLDVLVEKVLSQCQVEIQSKRAEIQIEHPLPNVWSNVVVLEQVITNLLGNALKFVPAGVPPRVRIWAEEKPNAVRLSIKDNGIGIAKEYHQRIFRVFERLHKTAEYEGTGIGLAIASKGVERLGGHIGLDSEPGKGSCFWIELPRDVVQNEGEV